MYNYKMISRNLLKRYLKYLRNIRTDLEVKAIGSYWTKYKWTKEDQENWERVDKKINKINRIIL